MTNKNSTRTVKMVQMAILAAIMLLMAFTPIGYLKTAGIEISFMMIPVVVGAIVIGPGAGAILGGVFGATSFIQCFGMSVFGAALLSINPFYTFIVCMIPRILMGWLTGLVFKALNKTGRSKLVSFGVSSLSGALFNTIFFMTFLIVLFGNTEYIKSFQGDLGLIPFILAFVGINGLIEAIVCFVAGAAISRGLVRYITGKLYNS
jgi:uncharacterized membrane protein